MCGIVGYIGKNRAVPYLIEGLEKLEYRGYDSAGIAVSENDKINVIKSKGRLKNLESKIDSIGEICSQVGIGHTRWATHGKPSDENAHPHLSMGGLFCVVHNGIIENYASLRTSLTEDGFKFLSETDTEVIAQLLEKNYNGNVIETIVKTTAMLDGAYALAILCRDFPDEIVCVRKSSPLVVGKSEEGVFASSDVTAMLKYTNDVFKLDNDEIAVLTRDDIVFHNKDGEKIDKASEHIDWSVEDAQKGGFEHFMLKEIDEQPKALFNTISPRINDKKEIVFDSSFKLTDDDIRSLNKIVITACGSAYHVGVTAKYVFEKMTRLPVTVEIASEFRYSDPIIDENSLVIVISQSGETADSLAALRLSNEKGAKTLGVLNVVGSSIANESQSVIYTFAGPEIAVATTKAYSTQTAVMYLLSGYIAQKRGLLSADGLASFVCDVEKLPELVETVLKQSSDRAKEISDSFAKLDHAYYIGRNLDYSCAMEASLKMKEISYIHSEAYAAGELKHGTISLIEKGTVVVALAANDDVFAKTMSNIREVKARGAKIIVVSTEKHKDELSDMEQSIIIPEVNALLSSSLEILPMQLLAYYTAKKRGCDIDKPRNLAKSVTVE